MMDRKRAGRGVAALLISALAVLGCDSGTDPGDGGEDGVMEIHLTSGFAFSPSEVTIAPGTTVRWINDAAIFHTITPDGHSEWSRATVSASGETFEHTFDSTGTFPYFCEPHRGQGMEGTIIVEEGASNTGNDGDRDGGGY